MLSGSDSYTTLHLLERQQIIAPDSLLQFSKGIGPWRYQSRDSARHANSRGYAYGCEVTARYPEDAQCASNPARQTNVTLSSPPISVLSIFILSYKRAWSASPVSTEMQPFTVIVLLASLCCAPAIYKRIINNFKASTIHPWCYSVMQSITWFFSWGLFPLLGLRTHWLHTSEHIDFKCVQGKLWKRDTIR